MSTQPFSATSPSYRIDLTTSAGTPLQIGTAGQPGNNLWILNASTVSVAVQVGPTAASVTTPIFPVVGTPGTSETYVLGPGMLVIVSGPNAPFVNGVSASGSGNAVYLIGGDGQ